MERILALAILVTGLAAHQAAAQVPVLDYDVVDFSVITGRAATTGRDMIDSGLVLLSGGPAPPLPVASFLYRDGELETITGFSPASQNPMNSLGQMVGWAEFGPGDWDNAVYDDGTITRYELPDNVLVNISDSLIFHAFNVNMSAVVQGEMGGYDAVYYLGDRASTRIGSGWCNHDCDGWTQDFVIDLNDHDQALLNEHNDHYGSRAWIYDGRTGVKRFLRPDISHLDGEVTPMGFNDAGTVVGELFLFDLGDREDGPFLYKDGQMTLLQSMVDPEANWDFFRTLAVNNLDQILLWGRAGGEPPTQLLHFDAGEISIIPMSDLLPGVSSIEVVDFNIRGEILINGRVDGVNRAFLLVPIPIPEPAGLGAMVLGLMAMRRRRGDPVRSSGPYPGDSPSNSRGLARITRHAGQAAPASAAAITALHPMAVMSSGRRGV